jgi:DNA-binding MarR family transcriptional regulator
VKQFQDATNFRRAASAGLLMELWPLVMRTVRAEMRASRADLAVPQFRALVFLSRHPGASLSDVATRVDLTLSATSKRIEGLVARGLVTRDAAVQDRRYVVLALTPEGEALLKSARDATRARLAEALAQLSDEDMAIVERALELLRGLFEDESAGEGPG